MGKGNFLTTIVRGKLGNMVGYKVSQSNDKEKQGWRSYVAKVNNPKTAAQARQRMVVGNLTRNYSALKAIISRGFEGIPYGGASYREFLRMNMSSAGNGPYVEKGRKTPVPGPYLISRGSLIPIAVTGTEGATIDGVENMQMPLTDMGAYPYLAAQATTWGYVSRALIAGNTDVQDGDQLTFVEVCETSNLSYIYRFTSVIVDSTSTAEVTQVGTEVAVKRFGDLTFKVTRVQATGINHIDFRLSREADEQPVAGAVIQSRQGADGQWLRSTASLWTAALDEFNSTDAYEIALASYMNAESRGSDWPTEPSPEVTGVYGAVTYSVEVTEGEGTAFVKARGMKSSEDQLLYLFVRDVDGTEYLVDKSGNALSKKWSDIVNQSLYTKVNITDAALYGITF